MNIKRTALHQIIKKYLKTDNICAEKWGRSNEHKLKEAQILQIKSWIDENCTITLK